MSCVNQWIIKDLVCLSKIKSNGCKSSKLDLKTPEALQAVCQKLLKLALRLGSQVAPKGCASTQPRHWHLLPLWSPKNLCAIVLCAMLYTIVLTYRLRRKQTKTHNIYRSILCTDYNIAIGPYIIVCVCNSCSGHDVFLHHDKCGFKLSTAPMFTSVSSKN